MSQGNQVERAGLAVPGKYLTFFISRERYGFEILKVQEIIKVPYITFVPRCPSYVRGVINLRGKIIPVIDLRTKFGISNATYDAKTCIIVINAVKASQKMLVGVVVDTVLEVLDFTKEQITNAPNYGETLSAHFVTGMATRDEHLNILIDIDAVVASTVSLNIVKDPQQNQTAM
jgi:purine-binding chemotaxis protein CheW